MGWGFRKSKTIGPFRFNFSKSGVSTSFGVKGARVNFGHRGTYVTLGSNGVSYRQRIDNRSPNYPNPGSAEHQYLEPANAIHTVTSRNVDETTDVDSEEFVRELESKVNKMSFLKWLGVVPSVIILFAIIFLMNRPLSKNEQNRQLFTVRQDKTHVRERPDYSSKSLYETSIGDKFQVLNQDSAGWLAIAFQSKKAFIRASIGIVSSEVYEPLSPTISEQYSFVKFLLIPILAGLLWWCIIMYNKDKKRKTLEINYTFDEDVSKLHRQFLEYFREFSSSRKIWQNLHNQSVSDRKHNAGATQLIARVPLSGLSPDKRPSSFLQTNVSIPFIKLRNIDLYFFPERLILKRANKFGALLYKNLTITNLSIRFIEQESVASDAQIVDHTYRFVNKNGGPDKRFNNNRRIPICLYSEYVFESNTGIHESITTSKVGGMDKLCNYLKVLGEFQSKIH